MSIEEVEALSFLMTLKNAIMDLPYVHKNDKTWSYINITLGRCQRWIVDQ